MVVVCVLAGMLQSCCDFADVRLLVPLRATSRQRRPRDKSTIVPPHSVRHEYHCVCWNCCRDLHILTSRHGPRTEKIHSSFRRPRGHCHFHFRKCSHCCLVHRFDWHYVHCLVAFLTEQAIGEGDPHMQHCDCSGCEAIGTVFHGQAH